MDEQPLTGGNTTAGVVRVGDTVRRPAGPQTPAVQAFLAHLHDVGFRQVPRPLGLDERGREVLSFVPGDPVFPDRLPASDPALAEIGRLIRRLHDASASFTPPPGARWRVAIPDVGADLVVHHDLAPWNLVRGDTWYLIDWDGAGPGTRLWDLAYAAHGFVPLAADVGPAAAAHRLRVLAGAYGLDEPQRLTLLGLLARRTQSMVDLLRSRTEPWETLRRAGHDRTWAANTAYIAEHADVWRAALLDA